MTVSNTTAKLQYAGDGTTRTFGITFPLLSADHLSVVVTDTSGTETQITNNYTLSDDLDSITYPTVESGLDPLAEGYKITLVRQTPLTQQIDLHSGGVLDAEQLETGYDKLTLLVQELKAQLDRCIKYAVSNSEPQAAEQFLSDIETAASNAANSATAASASASASASAATNAQSAAATCATADTKISNHNDSNTAHADIRALIKNYTAGTNVTISDDGVISAQDTTYTAGTNVTIVGNVISATGGGGGGLNPSYDSTNKILALD